MNRLNYNPDKHFWYDDMSFMQFEDDFTNNISTNYPARSLEEHFVKHMQKQGEPFLYFKQSETFDGRPHVFRFQIVEDEQGNEWYSYIEFE